MKRNVKKESIVIDGTTITFMQYAQQCYKAQKRKEDFDLYLLRYKKDLTLGWDIIVKGALDKAITTKKKNEPLSTKIVRKIVEFTDKVFK